MTEGEILFFNPLNTNPKWVVYVKWNVSSLLLGVMFSDLKRIVLLLTMKYKKVETKEALIIWSL